jgi:hypothetical protein
MLDRLHDMFEKWERQMVFSRARHKKTQPTDLSPVRPGEDWGIAAEFAAPRLRISPARNVAQRGLLRSERIETLSHAVITRINRVMTLWK